jgi:hypothetical protein
MRQFEKAMELLSQKSEAWLSCLGQGHLSLSWMSEVANFA